MTSGAGAEGGREGVRLSEGERDALRDWWDSEAEGDTAGTMLANLDAAVEAILAARRDPGRPPCRAGWRGGAVSATYVVETVAGTWAMDCCDDAHTIGEVLFAEYATKSAAEAAARAHRAEDRRDRAAYEAQVAGCCRTCGRAL